MARTNLTHDPFDPRHMDDPQAAAKLLSYLDDVQGELDRVKHELDNLQRNKTELRRGLANLDRQLELARQLQPDPLPRYLPSCRGLRLHRLFSPAHVVSGDTHLITRITQQQMAISIADAVGHGMASAILSIFVDRILRTNLTQHETGEPTAPPGVLSQLNRALINEHLSDDMFATCLHMLYEESTRRLTWSRGGAPYPILKSEGEAPVQLITDGGIVGLFEDPRFALGEHVLRTGDVVLIFSDGLEALLLNTADGCSCDTIAQTSWCRSLTAGSIRDHLSQIEDLLASTPECQWPVDDVTIVVLEALRLIQH